MWEPNRQDGGLKGNVLEARYHSRQSSIIRSSLLVVIDSTGLNAGSLYAQWNIQHQYVPYMAIVNLWKNKELFVSWLSLALFGSVLTLTSTVYADRSGRLCVPLSHVHAAPRGSCSVSHCLSTPA